MGGFAEIKDLVWKLQQITGEGVCKLLMENKEIREEAEKIVEEISKKIPSEISKETDQYDYLDIVQLVGFLTHLDIGMVEFLAENFNSDETPIDNFSFALSEVIDQLDNVVNMAPVEFVVIEDDKEDAQEEETGTDAGMETTSWSYSDYWGYQKSAYGYDSYSPHHSNHTNQKYTQHSPQEKATMSWDKIPW